MSLKERIRQAKRKGQPLEVPEWGETIYLRRLSAREALDLREWSRQFEKSEPDSMVRNVETMVRVVILSAADEQGNRLFDESDKGWLEDSDQGALERIMKAAMEAAGMTETSREDIRKNSETAVGASPAASHSPLESPVSDACSSG